MEAKYQPKYYNVSVIPHVLENENPLELDDGYDIIRIQVPGVLSLSNIFFIFILNKN